MDILNGFWNAIFSVWGLIIGAAVLILFCSTAFGLLGVVAQGVTKLVSFGLGFAVRVGAVIALIALFAIMGIVIKNTGIPGLPAQVASSYAAPPIAPPSLSNTAPAVPAQAPATATAGQ